MGIDGTFGASHLYENRSFLSLDDCSNQGISGFRCLWAEGSTTQKGSVSLGVGYLGFTDLCIFGGLVLRIFELLHPAVDIGLDSSGIEAEVEKYDFSDFP